MKVSEFNYNLPEELIAQVPLELKKRDESRLMVLNREKETIEHKKFKNIIEYLKQGDCLVRNNTKKLYQQEFMVKKKPEHMLNFFIIK